VYFTPYNDLIRWENTSGGETDSGKFTNFSMEIRSLFTALFLSKREGKEIMKY
jgi:hypothetical protein